jgi:hypothetical protein
MPSILEKQAELHAILEEIASERRAQRLADADVRLARDERRLSLERELAEAAGREYAEPIPFDEVLGDEWHVVSNHGRDTALFCGDVGESTSLLVHFDHTMEFRVSGLYDDDDSTHPLVGHGLGTVGLFRVRHSRWKHALLETASSFGTEREQWLSRFEHLILRGKGGELSCLAIGYRYQRVPEGIESIRARLGSWRAATNRA